MPASPSPPFTCRYYGCGSPFLTGVEGLTVLDLGSGSGRDCYVVAAMVGEAGHVIGIDMTEEQLDVARKHVDSYCREALGYAKPNMSFVKVCTTCVCLNASL